MAGDAKRLGIWKDFLRCLPLHDQRGRTRFYMHMYTDGRFLGEGYDALSECDTVGCAVGWAVCIPEFRALGWNQKYGSAPRI